LVDEIQTLKKWLAKSNYTVVFTGAGMSTESGLPDFRSSPLGLWRNQNPRELASVEAIEENRYEFIEFYRNRIETLHQCRPNTGHAILAKWEKGGIVQAIITQNVDGLHHVAGNKMVTELHGTLRSSHCTECKEVYPIERFLEDNVMCECGGFIRPSVVLFGEPLSEEVLIQAVSGTTKAELFLVLGSFLSVSPANFFPVEAKEAGAKLVIINMEPTKLDDLADLVIHHRKISEVLQELG
jgi:NAD-dependent deacetylase